MWPIDDIINILMNFLLFVFYPVLKGVSVFFYLANYIWSIFVSIPNAIIALGNLVVGFYSYMLVNIFPSSTVAILGTALVIVGGIRLYLFIKDLHIFGWGV